MSNKFIFKHLLLMISIGLSMANLCPDECSCFRGGGSWIVDCSSRELTAIPSGIPETTTELFLQNNRITTLPEMAFQSLVHLEFLYLHENVISSVDVTTFAGAAGTLKYLTLSHNEITTLPDDVFAGMTSLKVLNLNDNKLEAVNSGLIREMEELVQVSFCNNNLTYVDEAAFSNLRNLLYIGLSQNNLRSVPDSLGEEAKDVYLIDFGENQLEKLPKIASTTRQIYATGGNIAALTKGPLDNASTLYELFVSGNAIERIDEGAFAGATSLAWLDLSYNQISDVDDVMFQNISGLLGLYLTENRKLTSVSKNAFYNFRQSVYRLSIDNCSLTWLDGDTINMLTNPKLYTWAGGNPWNCDCALESFSSAVAKNERYFYDIDLVTCSAPKNLIGQNVGDVTSQQCKKQYVTGPGYNKTALISCMCVAVALLLTAIPAYLCFKSRKNNANLRESSTSSQRWTPAKHSDTVEA